MGRFEQGDSGITPLADLWVCGRISPFTVYLFPGADNCGVSDLPPMRADLLTTLRRHNWRRAFWYSGK
jgi:hypothetical protein